MKEDDKKILRELKELYKRFIVSFLLLVTYYFIWVYYLSFSYSNKIQIISSFIFITVLFFVLLFPKLKKLVKSKTYRFHSFLLFLICFIIISTQLNVFLIQIHNKPLLINDASVISDDNGTIFYKIKYYDLQLDKLKIAHNVNDYKSDKYLDTFFFIPFKNDKSKPIYYMKKYHSRISTLVPSQIEENIEENKKAHIKQFDFYDKPVINNSTVTYFERISKDQTYFYNIFNQIELSTTYNNAILLTPKIMDYNEDIFFDSLFLLLSIIGGSIIFIIGNGLILVYS